MVHICKHYGCFSEVSLSAEPLLPNPFSSSFLLCPAVLSTVTTIECLLTFLCQPSFLKMFIFTVLQVFSSFPLLRAFSPQLYCHLLSCRTDLPLQPIKPNLHKFTSEPEPVIYFLAHFLFPADTKLLSVTLRSSAVAYLLFCLLEHSWCSFLTPARFFQTHFFLQMLISCRPMAQICTHSQRQHPV